MIAEAIVSYPTYIILIWSYRTNNYEAAYLLIILVLIRVSLGFLNPPGAEVGPNRDGRLAIKWMAQLAVCNYSMNLACHIYKRNLHKVLIQGIAYLFILPSVYFTTFKHDLLQ